MLNWPDSSQPPATASSTFGIERPSARLRPIGISQIGAIERRKGRSSPPSLCSTLRPAISGPVHEVSSNSLDQVNELITPNPLAKRCSTLTSAASYWFEPHG